MKRITPAVNACLYYLKSQLRYFKRNNRLDIDGSFYKSDDEIAKWLGVVPVTVKRWREFLQDIEKIKFISGACRGKATKYWILEKDNKMLPFQGQKKPNKISGKPNKLCLKDIQNVTPNIEINNRNNILSDSERGKMHKKCQELIKNISNKAKRPTDETSNPG